jgi:hypothetical protein
VLAPAQSVIVEWLVTEPAKLVFVAKMHGKRQRLQRESR